jgi:hypothetical protein
MAILETAFVEFLFNVAACILILACARKRSFEDALVGLGVLVAYALSQVLGMIGAHPLSGQAAPTLDWFLYRADQRLGLGSVDLCRCVLSTSAPHLLLVILYQALPIAFAVVWSLERSRVLVRAEVIATIAGFACYHLVPAVGPIFAFTGFPFVTPHASGWMLVDTSFARNCFPSLHFGWSLLLLWNCRKRSSVCFASIFLFGITLATVGLGVHYFVDLLAAVPFCGAMQFIATRKWHGLPFHIGKLPQIREARTA